MALLSTFLSDTSSTTDLNGELLTLGVSNKLAGLLLNVPGGTGRLIDSTALLRALAIAHLLEGPVALLHILFNSLLLEGDLTALFKVLLANFLLGGVELCDIGVMALLNILVVALKNGILLQGLDNLLVLDTAVASLGISDTVAEVNTSSLDIALSATPKEGLLLIPDDVSVGNSQKES